MASSIDGTQNPTLHAEKLMEQLRHGPFASEFARNYNERTGGCNILLAKHLISLVKPHLPPPPSPLRILDNACGPLVLTTSLLQDTDITASSNIHISAADINPSFIANAQVLISSTPTWNTPHLKVDAATMNGMDLHFPSNTFSLSFTSLAIFAFPDPVKGASELHRTLKPGGVAALTTWKRVAWLPLLHAVERIIRPDKQLTTFPFLEAWQVPGKLARTLEEGGFREVVEDEVVSWAWFEGVEVAAKVLVETLGMLGWEGWTEGEKAEMRVGLERGMEGGSEFVRREGGKVGFEMVAWTGVGRK